MRARGSSIAGPSFSYTWTSCPWFRKLRNQRRSAVRGPRPALRDILDNFAQRTVSRRRLGAPAPREESTEEMDMDSHGIRAGWPFNRQVDFPLGEKMQLEADAVGEVGNPGESPGGGTRNPGERMNGWRRMGWKNEDNTASTGWARWTAGP